MKIRWNGLEREWRKQLLSYAKGNILEAGVGEGDNFQYYPLGVQVIATDMSQRLIEKARTEAGRRGVKAEFMVSSLEDIQFPQQHFDTIVSTFSLSSYENPVEALRLLSTWCKPEGKILLLEYGLSKYRIVNWLQRKWEPFYYRKTGNHIDRDLLAIISGSGLHIKRVEIKYAGTVYLVWATLSPGHSQRRQ